MNQAQDLRRLYDSLWVSLKEAKPSEMGNLSREIRLVAEKLERLEAGEEVSFFDELGAKRDAAGVVRPAGRRRQSG